mmetsp:Transcript_20667/g.48788  ORF Transcript_20667/g.48788 Transcript_20667/m.48788 type:complete len:572 (+) Transcript_20667:122-1837(+)
MKRNSSSSSIIGIGGGGGSGRKPSHASFPLTVTTMTMTMTMTPMTSGISKKTAMKEAVMFRIVILYVLAHMLYTGMEPVATMKPTAIEDENAVATFEREKKPRRKRKSREDKRMPPSRGYEGPAPAAFCLLIRDDNDILDEWVGYHYHTMRMRRLIVAADPKSVTDPRDVLEKWTKEGSGGSFDLKVTVWTNDTFTPDHFRADPREPKDRMRLAYLAKDRISSDKLVFPDGVQRTNTSLDIQTAVIGSESERKALEVVNDHKVRQRYFLHECSKLIKSEVSSGAGAAGWAVHIDTDEYLVPNPWASAHVYENATLPDGLRFPPDLLREIFPRTPSEGSMLTYLNRYLDASPEITKRGCVMAPRVLFGDKEDGDVKANAATATSLTTVAETPTTTTVWRHAEFGTLRYKYHNDHSSHGWKRTGMPMKGMIDVRLHQLNGNEGFRPEKIPFSLPGIHMPSTLCKPMPNTNFIANDSMHKQPMAVYHYLGSLERYMFRPGDKRRNPRKYHKNNANANFWGDTNNPDPPPPDDVGDRWWIKGWFDDFVATHGADAAYEVFGPRFASRTTNNASAA